MFYVPVGIGTGYHFEDQSLYLEVVPSEEYSCQISVREIVEKEDRRIAGCMFAQIGSFLDDPF